MANLRSFHHALQVDGVHPDYDRLVDDRHLFQSEPMAAAADKDAAEVSLTGKMLSATVGSLLTSLLGESQLLWPFSRLACLAPATILRIASCSGGGFGSKISRVPNPSLPSTSPLANIYTNSTALQSPLSMSSPPAIAATSLALFDSTTADVGRASIHPVQRPPSKSRHIHLLPRSVLDQQQCPVLRRRPYHGPHHSPTLRHSLRRRRDTFEAHYQHTRRTPKDCSQRRC
jgi:hypothetical protein